MLQGPLSAVPRRVPRISALSGLWTCTMRWDTTEGCPIRGWLQRDPRDVSDKKNPQVVDLLGGFFWTPQGLLGRLEILFWWSWGESNPRPKAIAGQIYMFS